MKKIISIIIFGALLIGALFYFQEQKQDRQNASVDPVPDFRSSNHPSIIVNEIAENQKITASKIESTVAENNNLLNQNDQAKLTVFKEILISRNDNDPRLDQVFKHNSKELKEVLQKIYQKLPMESRNERGTIAYLIARDIQTEEDVQFLEGVFKEDPCLSLEDCKTISNDDPHFSGINQTSANYPQQVVLYQLDHFDQQLTANPSLRQNSNIRNAIENLLRTAALFPVPLIREKAEKLQKKFGF